MTYIKTGEQQIPATITGRTADRDWDDRQSKSITIESTYADAIALFTDGLSWSIIAETDDGTEEYDNSDYSVAGDVTDHRDGTITVKMGKETDLESMLILIYGEE